MSKTHRPWDPDQQGLLPPSPKDSLPEGDWVDFVMDVVRPLDISAITDSYERRDRGSPPYHPRMMVTTLVCLTHNLLKLFGVRLAAVG